MAEKLSPLEVKTQLAMEGFNPFQTIAKKPKRPKKAVDPVTQDPLPEPEILEPEEDEVAEREVQLADILVKHDPRVAPTKIIGNIQQIIPPPPGITPAPFPDMVAEMLTNEPAPSYRAEWMGRDLFVGFPCYKTTNPVTAWCLLAMALDFGRDKIQFDMEFGDAMIYHARNKLARKFLASPAQWLLMIDDDIIPAVGRPNFTRTVCRLPNTVKDVCLQRHVIHRLVGSGKTLIGGAYFGRQPGGRLMCDLEHYTKAARNHEDRVVKCKWLGTGCMLVHRKVFEDIQRHFPELQPKDPQIPFDFFRPLGNGVGEDISFCHRASKANHDPHIDLGLPVYHVGYYTYGGGTL